MSKAIPFETFQPSMVEFRIAETTYNGQTRKKIYVNPKDAPRGSNFLVQMGTTNAMLRMPFTPSCGLNNDTNGVVSNRLNMELAVKEQAHIDAIERMQDCVVSFVQANSKEIFGKPCSMEVARDRFQPAYKPAPQEGLSNLVRMKLNMDPVSIHRTKMYQRQPSSNEGNLDLRETHDIASVIKGSDVMPIAKLEIWMIEGTNKYGLSFQVERFVYDSKGKVAVSGSNADFILDEGTTLTVVDDAQPLKRGRDETASSHLPDPKRINTDDDVRHVDFNSAILKEQPVNVQQTDPSQYL